MMNEAPQTVRVAPGEMEQVFYDVLIRYGFSAEKAAACARIFMENSLEGVYTHGVNRFPRFIEYVRKGYVQPGEEPVLKNRSGGIEQWDGRLGAGPVNALRATEGAMALAREHGIGCVAMANTNHWMRGGTYGRQAAHAGFVFIGWTNTVANMPAWGATDSRLGNNPLVLAVPYGPEAVVLDAAMSQYSYGAMELAVLKGEKLPFPGGYDRNGHLTDDPAAILESQRPLPLGYWKGAGLSLLLDLLAAVLSGGLSTHEISRREAEHAVSQVFIAIDISKLSHYQAIGEMTARIIADYRASQPGSPAANILYPGERSIALRAENTAKGIPVLAAVWETIRSL